MFPVTNLAVIAGGSAAMRQRREKEKEEARIMAIAEAEDKKHVFSQNILKESKFLHSWKERYVRLSHNYLMTFKPGSKPNTHLTMPTELISLDSVTEVLPIKNPEKKDLDGVFSFRVSGKDKHGTSMHFRFGCKSEEDRKKWITKIEDSIKLLRVHKPLKK